MIELVTLVQQCAPNIPNDIMLSIINVESTKNPFAIGVVKGSVKQPKTYAEAINRVYELHNAGKNFSMGIAQVNRYNLNKYGLTYETVFDPCKNVYAGSLILLDCYNRASKVSNSVNQSWQKAFSCYYSGNFTTGFKQDFPNQPPYVTKILNKLSQIQGQGSYLAATQPIRQNINSMNREELAKFANDSLVAENRANTDKSSNTGNVVKLEAKQVGYSWDTFSDFNATKVF
ncbi:lytic transglycosylase domain-containing protein [Acinetobacter pittii]|uniref:Lytic transglycosylase domain-containing protein n=1 Tax=Acinetobacter pittii TaxID=48296 RepID=A0A6H0G0A5_ACIPI|nr:lytic transglycosylase domain-containing protein [Acinetobacter pittii]QIT20020.1 lytic transglycosylase domain-containing protein [Acinetobacter pittii]